jgi:Flp pilus assembly protein TadG
MPGLRDERGDATTELVLVTPVLLLLIGFVVQFALWYHAAHVAEAAAQEGVRAARAFGGSAEAGQARAAHFLAETGPNIVKGPDVTAVRDLRTARVEVHGHAPSVVPGLRLAVSGEAESPTERFTTSAPGVSP